MTAVSKILLKQRKRALKFGQRRSIGEGSDSMESFLTGRSAVEVGGDLLEVTTDNDLLWPFFNTPSILDRVRPPNGDHAFTSHLLPLRRSSWETSLIESIS